MDVIINLFRSFPFIILIVVLALVRASDRPFFWHTAMTVSLTLSAIPFIARIMETSINEVGTGVIEAALAMGTSIPRLITKVLVPESLPALIKGMTTTVINIIGYSAMAGVVGGGGLGDLAIRWGLYNRHTEKLVVAVLMIVALVQIVQLLVTLSAERLTIDRN